MFQALIEQARSMIQRLHVSAEKGREAVPEAMRVRFSELEAWDAATQGAIRVLFGVNAQELTWWQTLTERRSTIVGEAMRKDIKRGEYFGLIDYFHLAIGALVELDVRYQHQQSAPLIPSFNSAVALIDQLTPRDQERLARFMLPSLPDQQSQPPSPAPGRWDLMVSVTPETYRWLHDMAAARAPANLGDGAAAAQLAAMIIERVVTNQRNGK